MISEKQRGGGLRGGETYHKTPPKKRFWIPPLMIRFPPFCSRPVIFLRGNGHRPDESHFLRPPKLSEGALYGMFPPPLQNRMKGFVPPFVNSQIILENVARTKNYLEKVFGNV